MPPLRAPEHHAHRLAAAPRDPAPSRLAYRAERLWLTPMFRTALRVGLPVVLALGLAGGYLADGPRRAATDLLARTRIWVGGGDGHDSISGRHLWRALRTFVDGIFKVNERNELLEYDRSIIRMAHGAIFGRGAPSGRVPPTLLKQLRRIAGRDAMIDRLLATGDADPQKWAEPLQRRRESL